MCMRPCASSEASSNTGHLISLGHDDGSTVCDPQLIGGRVLVEWLPVPDKVHILVALETMYNGAISGHVHDGEHWRLVHHFEFHNFVGLGILDCHLDKTSLASIHVPQGLHICPGCRHRDKPLLSGKDASEGTLSGPAHSTPVRV
eukprot:UN2125